MNPDVFNEAITQLSAVLGTFRSVELFPAKTEVLLDTTLKEIQRLRAETPLPSSNESDALIQLQGTLGEFKKNLAGHGRNLSGAREDFKKRLREFYDDFLLIAAENPAYSNWLSRLPGFKLLEKMVGA